MTLTLFTPSYNRAYTLPRLYHSLTQQTHKDFEWLIIDDGSTDQTENIVRQFMNEKQIDIRYYKQPNGGKHRAINRAISLARGEWFFIVDSDDYLPPSSVQTAMEYARQISGKTDFAGIAGTRCYPNGERIGGNASYEVLDTDPISLRERHCINGDMAEVFRTDILRQYPFPEYEGEKFMSEGVIWNTIALKYKLRYFNHSIYTCDYLQDGLTQNIRKHCRQSPCGSMLFTAGRMGNKRYRLSSRLKSAINYWRHTIHYRGSRKGVFRPTWWSYLLYPLAFCLYRADLWKEHRKEEKPAP